MLQLLFFSIQSMRHVVIAIYFFDPQGYFSLGREGSFGFSDGKRKNWDIVLFASKLKYQGGNG